MAKNTTAIGSTIDGVTVVHPDNMGNTLVFKDKVYNVNVGDTLTVGENGLVDVKLSKDKGNSLEIRDDGLYYGVIAPADTSLLYVSSSMGNDSNAGTRDQPLRTIAAAFRKNRPNQRFTVRIYENDAHEWKSSEGTFDNYLFIIEPYGTIADAVWANNPVATSEWARSAELKRPTVRLIADKEIASAKLTDAKIMNTFSSNLSYFNGCVITTENQGQYVSNGAMFGHAEGNPSIHFRGCTIIPNDVSLLRIGSPSGSNVILDRSIVNAQNGKLGYIETNGRLNLGFRSLQHQTGSTMSGNTSAGVPSTLTYADYSTQESVLANAFAGNTTAQKVGILY